MSDRSGRQRRRLTATVTDLSVGRQRAFLIGAVSNGRSQFDAEQSLEELALLSDTAGSDPVDSEVVRRPTFDPATLIGKGKLDELSAVTQGLDIDVVIFDNDLSPAQQRNLQRAFGCDVVDRQAVILDIFAQHASSREGSIQVELALLRYHLPRLRGKGTSLSQQGAGIGTRGPGETKLETDRRRILARISRLEKELAGLTTTRHTQRKARRKAAVPQVALVGYTNAGKSTLLNRLTDAGVLTEDRLFSTVDSTTRRATLPDGSTVLFSDTVGFVRRLPHELVEAFRSTLEEVIDSDLILHLVDASDSDPEGQIEAVRTVLAEIGAESVPEVLVLNKIDAVDELVLSRLRNLHPEAPAISALTGDGIDAMLEDVAARLAVRRVSIRLEIPYDRAEVVAAAHRTGDIVSEKHDESGTVLEVRLTPEKVAGFLPFIAG